MRIDVLYKNIIMLIELKFKQIDRKELFKRRSKFCSKPKVKELAIFQSPEHPYKQQQIKERCSISKIREPTSQFL